MRAVGVALTGSSCGRTWHGRRAQCRQSADDNQGAEGAGGSLGPSRYGAGEDERRAVIPWRDPYLSWLSQRIAFSAE
jgi:hypothetical protein